MNPLCFWFAESISAWSCGSKTPWFDPETDPKSRWTFSTTHTQKFRGHLPTKFDTKRYTASKESTQMSSNVPKFQSSKRCATKRPVFRRPKPPVRRFYNDRRLQHVYDRYGTAQSFLRAAAELTGKKWWGKKSRSEVFVSYLYHFSIT